MNVQNSWTNVMKMHTVSIPNQVMIVTVTMDILAMVGTVMISMSAKQHITVAISLVLVIIPQV